MINKAMFSNHRSHWRIDTDDDDGEKQSYKERANLLGNGRHLKPPDTFPGLYSYTKNAFIKFYVIIFFTFYSGDGEGVLPSAPSLALKGN